MAKAVQTGSVSQPKGLSRLLWRIALACIFLCLAVLVTYVIYGISVSLQAENTLLAVCVVSEIVETYVRETGGNWPRSWDDLESVEIAHSGGYSWPADRPQLEARVHIDFEFEPEKSSIEDAKLFYGIEPIGPCYQGFERCFLPLLKALRSTNPHLSRMRLHSASLNARIKNWKPERFAWTIVCNFLESDETHQAAF